MGLVSYFIRRWQAAEELLSPRRRVTDSLSKILPIPPGPARNRLTTLFDFFFSYSGSLSGTHQGMFLLFFLLCIFFPPSPAGSELTNLSDCGFAFKRRTWGEKRGVDEGAEAEQLDPRFLHECQGRHWSLMISAEDRCTAAGGAVLAGRRRNYNAASDKDSENKGEEHESLS